MQIFRIVRTLPTAPLATALVAAALAFLAPPALPAAAAPAPAAKASGAAPRSPQWLGSVAEAQSQARKGGKLIFVDLYADWCGWCKQLDAKVFSTPQFQDWAKQFVLLRVDTEQPEGARLQSLFGAETLPTTLLLTPDLVLAGKLVGFAPASSFMQRLDAERARWQALDDRYDLAVKSKDGTVVREEAQGLHERGDGRRAATLYRRVLELGGMPAEETAWMRYLLADALRMSGDYRGASVEVAKAHGAVPRGSEALLERVDLLAVQIAEQDGDCRQRVSALEAFLKAHPASQYSAQARRSLQELSADTAACG